MAYTATSRQTIAKVQGKSAMTRNVKSTIVEGRKAILVQINWTTAPVIKTTVRKNFKLSVLAMDTKTWMPIQRGMMNLKAGQVIHYTQSSEHPGYYYITIVGESCTCMAGLYKQPCHHQEDAETFEAGRCTTWVTMPNGTQRLASQVDCVVLDQLDAMADEYAAKQAAWKIKQAEMMEHYKQLASIA